VKPLKYCKRCVCPQFVVNMDFDDEGICSACRAFEDADLIPEEEWKKRKVVFEEILSKRKQESGGDYDCIVPVGGGKDSYWQVHVIKSYGLKPLLVTYHGNNYLPEGQENLDRMRDALDCDHYVFGPSVDVLKKLNRIGFKKMGDMNWHNHVGINILPMTIAVKMKIPLVIWGEIGWDVFGAFSPDDYAEYNIRMILEHDLRGYTLEDMIGEEGLTEQDLNFMKIPSDEDFSENKLRGLFVGNFIKWDPYSQTKTIQEKYGWESSRLPFERTYRRISNLDDMHENGIHDYMKYIKFGYGRATDHAAKDIRTGYMTREEGIEKVLQYDHVKPRRDLDRWLKYVDMTEEEFDRIADTFRDPRVWEKDSKGKWVKDSIIDFDKRQSQQ
jgi:N-acetyl sugar amidotransferase